MMTMDPNENDFHWMGGFFDGEGSISIVRQKQRRTSDTYNLRAYVGQTNPSPLRPFLSHFGGRGYTAKSPLGRKRMFRWQVTGKKAYDFLKTILPYLRHPRKREKARLGIEFWEKAMGKPYRKRSPSRIALQKSYYERARNLNKRPETEE